MLEAPNAPASQDAKTLVPMSLSLVVKKEKILQMEAAKLEKLLPQRIEILRGLQESHEYLLMTNGQLQERSLLRRKRLVSLRTLLEEHLEDNRPDFCDAIGSNELNATAEKSGVLEDVLFVLLDKRTGLERQCMGLEEQMVREQAALKAKEERLGEVRSTLRLLREDINSTRWNIATDQDELANRNKYLDTASQMAHCQTLLVNELDVAIRVKKASNEALRTTWQNYECMVHEEHRQLVIANEYARSEQRELQKLLGDNGATCLVDEEVLQAANDQRLSLQKLKEDVAVVKKLKRELSLCQKQENNMLAIMQSSMKAKDEQLTWLNRRCVHLTSEHNEASKANSADEAAFCAFREEHNVAMATLDLQVKDAEKHMKTTERAIAIKNKKVATISKNVLQKSKVCKEWQAMVKAKQDQVARSEATQKLVDAEVLSLQEALEQIQRRGEQIQQLSTAQNMESMELHKSCAVLEAEIQHLHTTLSGMSTSITSAQTVVNNRIDEIRDKFLSKFVADDADILIELLDKEINSWIKKDTDEVNRAVACETSKLKEKYEVLANESRMKFGTIIKQKKRNYEAKIDKLKKNMEKHVNSPTARKGEKAISVIQNVGSTTDHDEEKEKISGTKTYRHISSSSNEAVVRLLCLFSSKRCLILKIFFALLQQVPSTMIPLHKAHSTQLSRKSLKSARRQLAPRLSLVNNSPQMDKKEADVFDVKTAAVPLCKEVELKGTKSAHSSILQPSRLRRSSGARHVRLRRRTQAQKTGKPAAAKITPEPAHFKDSDCDTSKNLFFSAIEISKQNPCNSPIVCNDDPAVSNVTSHADYAKNTSFVTNQEVVEKHTELKRQLGHRSKSISKRRTSMKALNRPRQSKSSNISLGRSQPIVRTVDWSAADTFSFD